LSPRNRDRECARRGGTQLGRTLIEHATQPLCQQVPGEAGRGEQHQGQHLCESVGGLLPVVGEGAIDPPDPSGRAFEAAVVRDGGECSIEQRRQEIARRVALIRGFAQHLRNDQTQPLVQHLG
jgi:hypothetical protein